MSGRAARAELWGGVSAGDWGGGAEWTRAHVEELLVAARAAL
ncbi:hypothetical protein [Streptomyces sp. NPDC058294]